MAFVTLTNSPVHLLHRVSQCAADEFAAAMKDTDLTPRQYAVLASVGEHEGLSQTGLVERTGIDRSTLADIVRRMLRKGYLQRQRTKHDARAYEIRLSAFGAKVLESAQPKARDADMNVLAALAPHERRQLVEILNRIIDEHEQSHGAAGRLGPDDRHEAA